MDTAHNQNQTPKLMRSKKNSVLLFLCLLLIIFGGLLIWVFTTTSNNKKISNTTNTNQTINSPTSKILTLKLEVNATQSGQISTFLKVTNPSSSVAAGLNVGIYLKSYQSSNTITKKISSTFQSSDITIRELQKIASDSANQPPVNDLLESYTEVPLPTIKAGGDLVLPIKLNIPKTLKAGTYKLEAIILTDLGSPVVSDFKVVNLAGDNRFLSFTSNPCAVYVNNNFKKGFPPEIGALANPGETVTGRCTLTNNGPTPITISGAKGSWSQFHVTKYPFTKKQDISSSSAVLIKPNETKTISFTLPAATSPQVYEAAYQLIDSESQPVSPFLSFRWTVKGASAKIESASLDQNYYYQGDPITASVVASPSMDLYWNSLGQQGTPLLNPKLSLKIVGENNQICGQKITDLPKASNNISWPKQTITLTSSKDCKNPNLNVQILDGTTILVDYNKVYPTPDNFKAESINPNHKKILLISLMGLFVITLVVILFTLKTKKQNPSLTCLILFFLLFLIAAVYSSYFAPTVYGQPAPNSSDVSYPAPATFSPRYPNEYCDYNQFLAGVNCGLNFCDLGRAYSNDCDGSASDPNRWGNDFVYSAIPGTSATDNGNGTWTIYISGVSTSQWCDNNRLDSYILLYLDGNLVGTSIAQQSGGPFSGTFSNIPVGPERHIFTARTFGESYNREENCVIIDSEGNRDCGPQYGYTNNNEHWTQNSVVWTFEVDNGPQVTEDPITAPTCPASGITVPVTISWTSRNAAFFDVFRTDRIAPLNGPSHLPASQTSFTDTTAQINTTYGYYVRAYDNTGTLFVDSNQQSVTTPHCTQSVSNLTGSGICAPTPSDRQVTLNWDVSPTADSYNILRDGTLISSGLPASATSFVDSSPPAGSHTYTVNAISATASDPASVTVSVPSCDPNPPTISINSGICYDTDPSTPNPDINAISIFVSDPPPNPSGIASVTTTVTDQTTGSTSGPINIMPSCIWSPNPANVGFGNGTCRLTSGVSPNSHVYSIIAQAQDNGGNSTTSPLPAQFTYRLQCSGPWIQTNNGDVHSNSNINTPGGPN